MLFDSFPPVLQVQLKRFEYDFQRDVMVKVIFHRTPAAHSQLRQPARNPLVGGPLDQNVLAFHTQVM